MGASSNKNIEKAKIKIIEKTQRKKKKSPKKKE